MAQLNFKVKVRWWLKPVMAVLITVRRTTGWRPSESAVDTLARRATYIEFIQ